MKTIHAAAAGDWRQKLEPETGDTRLQLETKRNLALCDSGQSARARVACIEAALRQVQDQERRRHNPTPEPDLDGCTAKEILRMTDLPLDRYHRAVITGANDCVLRGLGDYEYLQEFAAFTRYGSGATVWLARIGTHLHICRPIIPVEEQHRE